MSNLWQSFQNLIPFTLSTATQSPEPPIVFVTGNTYPPRWRLFELLNLDNASTDPPPDWQPPTIGVSIAEFTTSKNSVTIRTLDTPRRDVITGLMRILYMQCQAVIFVISGDTDDCSHHLAALFDVYHDTGRPILVLLDQNSKQQVHNESLTRADSCLIQNKITQEWDTVLRANGKARDRLSWHFCPCNIESGEGLKEGFTWLQERLNSPCAASKVEFPLNGDIRNERIDSQNMDFPDVRLE